MASITATTILNITHLDFILSELERLDFSEAKWEKFGLKCGLYKGRLETLEADYPKNASKCFRECIGHWLRREDGVDEVGEPTLERLADILEETGNRTAAEKIRICNGIVKPPKDLEFHQAIQSMPVNSVKSSALSRWIVLPVSVLVVVIAILVAVTMIYSSILYAPQSASDVMANTATTIQMPNVPVTHSHSEQKHDVTSVVDDYASEIREKYNKILTRYKDPDFNKYPAAGPTAPDKAVVPFIPLKLMKTKSVQKKAGAELLFRAKGNLEHDNLEKIEIHDILKPPKNKQLKFVLIEGEPGIGKSTLAKELTLRWVRRTDALLTNFKIVILIQLRFETYQKAETFEDLLTDAADINTTEIALLIKRTKGADVLWILDGFDELPHQLRTSSTSIFIKLIKGDVLSKSTVIVTSRHAAIFPLLTFLEDDSKLIALRGFGPNEILQYVSEYFNKNKTLASEFYSYYSGNTMIESMLYNPMTCFIMCTIFDNFILTTNNKYPVTMTTVYNYYVRVLLKRHLIDAKVIDIYDDCDMPQHLIRKIEFDKCKLRGIWEDFYYLSTIAYNKVLKQEYVFGKELRDVPKLSMMDTIISFTGFDKDESSSFIHTTLQEYLAAIYLVNNPGSMFTKEDMEQNSNLEVVLTFYIGLLKYIDRKVDNKTMDMIFNYTDDFERNIKNYPLGLVVGHNHYDLLLSDEKPYTQLTSLMLRCIYEHDNILYNTSFFNKNYVLSFIRLNITTEHNLHIFIARDFEYFICGYIIAAHNITLKLEPYNSSEIIAFKKGLQSHSFVKGKIKITLYKETGKYFNRMITEVLDLPSDIVIGLHLVSISDILHYQQLYSRFLLLQEVIIDELSFNINISENPLLNLKKLNQLNIRMIQSNKAADESVFELLKQLTAPGRPLRHLLASLQGAESIQILNLISMQSSLEELRLELTNLKLAGQKNNEVGIIWHKMNNSLTVNYFSILSALLAEHIRIDKMQLSSFITFYKIYNGYYTLTMSSESGPSSLNDFIKAHKDYMSQVPYKPKGKQVPYKPKGKLKFGKYMIEITQLFSPRDQYPFLMKHAIL